jgi:hypothetical protein
MSDDLEVCWKCQGSGMMLGDDGDPCICSHCKHGDDLTICDTFQKLEVKK